MSNRTQPKQIHDRKLPWKATAVAYLYFTTLSALVVSVLPSTQEPPAQPMVLASAPFVSMLERGSAVQGLSKVSSVLGVQGGDHGAL